MNASKTWDLKRIRAEGLWVSVGCRITNGRLLRLVGDKQVLDGLSDLPTLAQYTEVELTLGPGAPSTFILTDSLLSNPQIILGWQLTGLPILIGARRASAGHIFLNGLTQSGKSTMAARIAYQLTRLGYTTVVIGMKSQDPVLIGSMHAGCNSLTRSRNSCGRSRGKFYNYSLQPGAKTRGWNAVSESTFPLPDWVRAAHFLRALSQGGGEKDASRRYFAASEQALLQQLKNWGVSPRDLHARLDSIKQTREERYSTSGLRNEIAQLAAIEQANLAPDHPSNINLASLLSDGSALFFDACYQDVGAVGVANAALFLQTLVFTKRMTQPNRNDLLFVIVDEAQKFNQPLLKQLVEQCAGFGVRLILAYHNLSQMGDDWETIAMAQVRLFFSTIPGGRSDKLVQDISGTEKELEFTFNHSEGLSNGESTSYSSGSSGSSITTTQMFSQSRQNGYGLSEREKPVWQPNDTLDLNYHANRFVIQVSPGAEFAYFGPKAIVGIRHGFHLTWDEINRHAQEAMENSPDMIVPGKPQIQLPALVEFAPEQQRLRADFQMRLKQLAGQIQAAHS